MWSSSGSDGTGIPWRIHLPINSFITHWIFTVSWIWFTMSVDLNLYYLMIMIWNAYRWQGVLVWVPTEGPVFHSRSDGHLLSLMCGGAHNHCSTTCHHACLWQRPQCGLYRDLWLLQTGVCYVNVLVFHVCVCIIAYPIYIDTCLSSTNSVFRIYLIIILFSAHSFIF